ncbi:MAG TPA: glycosyltransferase family 4 protein [Bacteriovoracaceae bacterium]|nr:glycosyltransferase family 4 protein [Bacteriovoracaceae bacterium]
MNIKFIANSQAVARELQVFFPQADIECIYNLAGDLPHRNIEKIKRIGVVAMFAPWKGLHEVLWMALFYEKELKAMGIEGISFYGADIYQTDGEHVLYFNQLKALNGKISPGFVEWRGKKSPSDIFSEIDLLVHSSILPEPFGRVIIEAFKSGIPVISTGLGGAAELLEGNKFGLTYQVHEYTELYKAIQSSCLNLSVTSLRNSAAFEISSLLEIHTKNKIRSIL